MKPSRRERLPRGGQGCPYRGDWFIKLGRQTKLSSGAVGMACYAIKLSGHDAQRPVHAKTVKVFGQGAVMFRLNHGRLFTRSHLRSRTPQYTDGILTMPWRYIQASGRSLVASGAPVWLNGPGALGPSAVIGRGTTWVGRGS